MALASSAELATWLRANQDKRGTPDYQTVLRGFQEAVAEESRAVAPTAPAAPKESTVLGEIARGGKQLVSTTRTGIGALLSPEEAARAGVERSQQIAAEAGEGPSFAALRKAYEERGLLPAAGELVSQIPRALAGQLPQLAALAGGAKLGAMAGTAVAPGVGTIAGGVLGAGASLLPQFFGANVERQAAEQMERGEPVSIDRTSAAAAAAGQAGIEAAGTAFVLGKRVVKGLLGVTDDAALATAKARADLVKAAERSRLGAAGRGAAVGLAEIPVEVAQAVIERAQAGLDVLSPEAISEYGENAYLAGLVGPTIGAATRVTEPGAARKKLAIEEQAKAAEERKATAAAEEAKKQSPEYLLDLEQRYKDAQTKKAQLDAAAVKPPKGADPATMVAHRDAVRARDEFAKTEMSAVAREYASRKKDIDALNAQRQQEAETAAAQEVPQAEQKLPFYESAQATIPGLEAVEAPAAAEETTAPVDYAAQVRNLRGYLDDLRERAQGTTDLDAKLRLGEEYARVQTALKEAEKETKAEGQGAEKRVESLRKKMTVAEEQGDIDAQVSIAKELKALGVTDLGAQEALDLGKPQPLDKLQIPTDLADYRAEQQRVADEAAAREAQKRQQQQLAREAYERSQQTAGMYADVAAVEQRKAADRAAAEAETKAEAERTQREEELVGKLVEATGAVQQQPAPQARVAMPTAGTREDTYDAATELRARLAFAQQTRNKTLEANIKRQLDQLGAAPEEARGSALELGEMAREAGVEGALTPEAMEQNRLSRLAQRQLLSYDQLVKHINRAREREQTAVDEKTKAQYKYRAEQLKQAALGFAIQEINGRRQQYGLPVLEQKEVMRAVTGLARPLNELIARGAQMFEEPVVVRGQQRGIRLVEGAQEFERPPAGRRTFPEAGFTSAADTLREQFRETVEKISGKPSAPPPRPGKPPGPVRKVVPEQRELFLTPPPAEEPVSLAPTALLDKGIDKAVSAEDARLLRQMQEVYTSLTPEQQSVVREQAQRATDGKPLDAVYEMRGLYQLQQREAATAAGQTTFLKPITLITARRKIERLAQQTAELAKEVREKLEPLIRGGVTRGLPELEYATKAAQAKAFAEKVAAGKKTDIERAQAAFDRAREQGKDLIDTAQQIRNARAKELAQFSEYVYTPLLNKQRQLNSAWDEATAEFTKHQFEYDDLRAAFDAGRAPKTNRAELETLSRLIPQTAARVVEISKQLDDINNRVIEAERVLSEIRERQAADTVTNSLLKEATKAQNKIETAQQKLVAAREAEKAAERAHNAVVGEVEKAPTPLEQIEALPIEGVTRVFRDTSDPAVQAQATKKRSAIAREEGSYALLEERLKKAEGKDKVALQRQLNESQERLQNLHNELYDVYNNAPLKRVQGKTPEAAASAERLEKARHEVHDAEINAFNAQHDTARLSLPARKAGPVISEKGVVKQAGEKVVKAEPETPIADIAKTRLRLAEIAQQLTYIKENKATSKEGKAKQAKAKDALTKEKTTLSARLRELLKQQTLVKREEQKISQELKEARTEAKAAIRRGKLEATDAQLFEDLAKATKTKEQTLLFERAENAFGEMSAPDQAFVRRQANAIVGRREADYKGEALAAIVTAAERRMEREGDVSLSRGATANPSTTASVRTELSKAFTDLGRVQIYDSVDALLKANPQYEGKIPSDARGFVDTAGNKAFLIAENIDQGQALSVLLHEVGAHIGLKNMLGDAQYNALVNAVKSWEKRTDNSTEAKVAKAARARVEAAETTAGQVNDELLAYTIEEAVNAGVKPTETKGVLGQWLSRVAALFRKALEKFGLPPKTLDAQGIVDMAFGAAKMEMGREAAAPAETGSPSEILFSRNLPTASRVAGQLIASQPSVFKQIKDNLFGWGFRAQFVDKLDPLLKAFKLGGVEDLKATQAMYYMRMYDQRMHFTSQAITEGAPEIAEKTRKDGRTERIIETKAGANIGQVVNILKRKDVVKAAGSADAANKLFTLYLASIRAERVGMNALNFGGKVTEADLKAARAEIEANDTLKNAFDEARDIYNQYNRNLLDFAVQTGAMAKDLANRLLAQNDYIPYYRMREGVAELVIGNETPIRIGNLKDSPHLKELVGGDEAIFDFLTSSVQNTSMLLDMSLKNLATKNAMFELRDVGLAKIGKVTKKSAAPEGSVTFKKDGEDYFAIVDTDAIGVNSELLVKGMAGIPTMFPAFVRVMGIPARFLRRTIVASPVYMARQLFRDTVAASMTSGADIVPVLGALRQIGNSKVLQSRGITGGQTLTGMPEDMTRILKDMQSGKISLNGGLAWLEAQSAKVDAATRKNQYDSYIAQGLSEMEATYMALESMNFSKRGLSPGLHMLSTIIPFFNAQIQGLDVLYKAFTKQMPMNERLDIRQKLWERGLMLAGLSFAYAMAMQDDETYQNAKPEEKYGNWFVKVPGFDQMVRLPIPFELGYIFKALPEAIVNTLSNEEGGKEALKAGKHIVQQMIPGASSYFIPAAVKPALEVAIGTSLYTGRSIESAEEQAQEPGYRYRDNTTELARQVGELTGFSPIKMEYLVRGYTGGMGMALLQMLSAPFGSTGPEAAAKRLSDLPVVGTLFQPNDASGIINATYERINEINRVKETYEGLLKKGRIEDARKYLDENVNEMALASVAGSFKQYMGEITKYEGAIRAAPGMTGEEKREKLDQLRQVKINLAKAVRGSVDKKEPQAAPA